MRESEGAAAREESPKKEEPVLQDGALPPPQLPSPPPALPQGPSPAPRPAEAEPQIGPEALLCHEVDLDDLDEREKPLFPPPEHLLLMMREAQQAPPPLADLLLPPSSPRRLPPQPLQVRPFHCPPASSTEVVPAVGGGAELRGAEQEGDSSTSSSTCTSLHLLEARDRGQKRLVDTNCSPNAKKHKRTPKRTHTPSKTDKNGAGHSSDSEDQSRIASLPHKTHKSRPAASSSSSPPSHGKDGKHSSSPQRMYKWTLQLGELDSMSSTERISFLQDKLQEMRKYYLSLKSEVASIDRRRKRLKKKEREVSHTTASTSSSGSSDTAMSPSSASPAQNTVAVECR